MKREFGRIGGTRRDKGHKKKILRVDSLIGFDPRHTRTEKGPLKNKGKKREGGKKKKAPGYVRNIGGKAKANGNKGSLRIWPGTKRKLMKSGPKKNKKTRASNIDS